MCSTRILTHFLGNIRIRKFCGSQVAYSPVVATSHFLTLHLALIPCFPDNNQRQLWSPTSPLLPPALQIPLLSLGKAHNPLTHILFLLPVAPDSTNQAIFLLWPMTAQYETSSDYSLFRVSRNMPIFSHKIRVAEALAANNSSHLSAVTLLQGSMIFVLS